MARNAELGVTNVGSREIASGDSLGDAGKADIRGGEVDKVCYGRIGGDPFPAVVGVAGITSYHLFSGAVPAQEGRGDGSLAISHVVAEARGGVATVAGGTLDEGILIECSHPLAAPWADFAH